MSIYTSFYQYIITANNHAIDECLGLRRMDSCIPTFEQFCEQVVITTAKEIPWNRGRPHTEETKRKISEVRKSQGMSEKRRIGLAAMAEKNRGRVRSDELKKKMSEAQKNTYKNGRVPNKTFLGRKHSEKTITLLKDIQTNREWKPSLGKTWKRSPESVAKAVETRRLNKLKKLNSDLSL